MIQDSELLRPSLTADIGSPRPIYSLRTGFLSSFIGGPASGAAVALLNSHRLRRLGRDWPVGALALAICVLMQWSISRHWWGWLDRSLGEASGQYVLKLLGLAFSGVVYAIHRPYYRSMSLLGLKSPDGTVVGIAAIVAGIALQAGLAYVMRA